MPEKKDVCLGLMSWPEIRERLKESDTALIPVGQTEQHGLHANIDLDSRNAEGIAIRAALAAFDSAKPVVAPVISYGYSDLPGLRDYPGVFSLRGETLVNLCHDVGYSLIRMGFTKIIFVNGHDANPPFVNEAVRLLTKKTGAFCAMAHISEMNNGAALEVLKKRGMPADFGHACLIETSIAMAFGMEVREGLLEGHYCDRIPGPMGKIFPEAPEGISYPAWERIEIMGGIWREGLPGPKGNPAGSSRDLGEELIQATIKPVVELIEAIRDFKPDVRKDLQFEV
jgi:creatinine amidohydrolase